MKVDIAERLNLICKRKGGSLSWQEVVEEARSDKSPLHPEFEWNKDAAHEIYLRDRARQIIRDWYIQLNTAEDNTVRTRRLVCLPNFDTELPEARRYYPIEKVLEDSGQREQMLQLALMELASFKRKYQSLSALVEVFAAIEVVQTKIEAKASPKSPGKKQESAAA